MGGGGMGGTEVGVGGREDMGDEVEGMEDVVNEVWGKSWLVQMWRKGEVRYWEGR